MERLKLAMPLASFVYLDLPNNRNNGNLVENACYIPLSVAPFLSSELYYNIPLKVYAISEGVPYSHQIDVINLSHQRNDHFRNKPHLHFLPHRQRIGLHPLKILYFFSVIIYSSKLYLTFCTTSS